MKKHYFYVGILAFLTLSSCSQEVEESQEQQRKELRSSSSIKELTEQLKAYNSQFSASTIVEQQEAVSRIPKITYSKGDMVKIAISDVKGGLRGVGGGAAGVIVGAATSSLIKFGKITVKKLIWGYIKDNYLKPYIHNSNSTCQYADSIGYYHNELCNVQLRPQQLQQTFFRTCFRCQCKDAHHVVRLQPRRRSYRSTDAFHLQ